MAQVTFRAPDLQRTLGAWQAKKARLSSVGQLGAIQIAETANAQLIPAAFPGRVRESVRAVAAPDNASLGRVIGVVEQPLFWWYTKGTGTYAGKGMRDIYPVRATALAFYWTKVGEHVFFQHVSNPGTRPHPEELAAFLAALHMDAYTTWRLLLGELLRS